LKKGSCRFYHPSSHQSSIKKQGGIQKQHKLFGARKGAKGGKGAKGSKGAQKGGNGRDWQCKCGAKVWASKDKCFKCGGSKSEQARGSDNTHGNTGAVPH